MLLYIALCLAATLAEDIGEQYPVWSKVYSLKMDHYIPALDLRIPYQYWYDGVNKKIRVDNGKTTEQFYVECNLTDYFNSLAVVVRSWTDEKSMNVRSCYVFNSYYVDNSILPDMTDSWVYRGTERMHGEDSVRWEMTKESDDIRKEYNLWFTLKQDVYIPLKIDYKSHNTKLGTLLSHYYSDIFDFNTSKIDPKIWDIGYGLQCKNDTEGEISIGAESAEQELEFLRKFQGHEEHSNGHDEFNSFKLKFNKVYQSDEEHNKRLQIFKKNVKFINDHNKAGHSYKLKINHFADLTEEERAMMKGRRHQSRPSKALPFPYTAEEIKRLSEDLPENFDWRPYGAVTPVKNQAHCGSCWAFSAVGAIEGALFLRDGREQVVRLSEQVLLDCANDKDNHGCGGGLQEAAYEWMKKHGLPNDDIYGRYLEDESVCNIDNVTKAAHVKDYYKIPVGDENAIKVALLKHGPLSVSINTPDELMFYSHGVFYSSNCGDYLDHAVLLVGYGTLDGEKYWLIKNSWGPGWGDSGYILMSTKDNNCCVETDAKYVELQ